MPIPMIPTIPIIAAGAAVIAGIAIYHTVKNRSTDTATAPSEARNVEAVSALSVESVQQILRYSNLLTGILEPMSRLSRGRMRNKDGIFSDWTRRICKMSDAPQLQTEWAAFVEGRETWSDSKYQSKAGQAVEWITTGGFLTRDSRATLIIEEEISEQYDMEHGESFPVGKKARIISPCWSKDGDVIEKGVLSVNED